MKSAMLRSALADLSSKSGFLGSALVNIEDGMVWHAVGSLAELESLASSASNYWRLNTRTQASFSELGPLQIAILAHQQGQLTICECGKGMLLVSVTNRRDTGYLTELKAAHPVLAEMVNNM
jgi:predicted regulator of Ras-like GTPase activity (Roadblock/LC7/MglB family)